MRWASYHRERQRQDLPHLAAGTAVYCPYPAGGDTFAEVPAFDGGLNPVNVEALETCRVWVVDGEKLRSLVALHPAFAQKVLANFGEMLRNMVRMVSEMAFYQVTHRLARLISEFPVEESRPTLDTGAARGAAGNRTRSRCPITQGAGAQRRDPHRGPPHPHRRRYCAPAVD